MAWISGNAKESPTLVEGLTFFIASLAFRWASLTISNESSLDAIWKVKYCSMVVPHFAAADSRQPGAVHDLASIPTGGIKFIFINNSFSITGKLTSFIVNT